ncbi:hypothetical protein B6U67_05320 [Methanosarcinales archaeon ex4484_138]|nr:MAG: hypothetical protein B6U67_05320 [Methanosarcinales archaeon ex4484_138]
MITVGVIKRGKYGLRTIETLRKRTPFQIKEATVPEVLPPFMEDAGSLIEDLVDEHVFDCDLLITYSLHPDLTTGIVEEAARRGVKSIIIPGGARRCDVSHVEKIASKYNVHLMIDEICCAVESSLDPVMEEFTAHLGQPELAVMVENGVVKKVRVLRGAPCGSTWHAAEKIVGTGVNDAAARMGLYVQQYPCRAIRGGKGGIHVSALLHKEAMERSLKNKKES